MVKEAPAPEPQAPAPKKALPVKTVLIVVALLVIEAAALIGVMHLAGPRTTEGAELHIKGDEAMEQIVEILVLKDKFPNNHSGRSWIWDVEVQVQVKTKHQAHVTERLENRKAEVRAGAARIWRTAQHNHFNEPSLETLSRQLTDLLNNIFGLDSQGRPYVVRVIISRCVGFPTEY
ncbi:MAG: hypothetical protein EA379_04830 [Phycisphaerales bacterium]|nr:MAG: hypothetical protein EA379_04830 [Phycisphaerales bacterium]